MPFHVQCLECLFQGHAKSALCVVLYQAAAPLAKKGLTKHKQSCKSPAPSHICLHQFFIMFSTSPSSATPGKQGMLSLKDEWDTMHAQLVDLVQLPGVDTVYVGSELLKLDTIWLEYLPKEQREAVRNNRSISTNKFATVWRSYWHWCGQWTNEEEQQASNKFTDHSSSATGQPTRKAQKWHTLGKELKSKAKVLHSKAQALQSKANSDSLVTPLNEVSDAKANAWPLVCALDSLQYDVYSHIQAAWMEAQTAKSSGKRASGEQQPLGEIEASSLMTNVPTFGQD